MPVSGCTLTTRDVQHAISACVQCGILLEHFPVRDELSISTNPTKEKPAKQSLSPTSEVFVFIYSLCHYSIARVCQLLSMSDFFSPISSELSPSTAFEYAHLSRRVEDELKKNHQQQNINVLTCYLSTSSLSH